MEMALYSVFLCGLYHRNLPGPNLKHICFRVCQVGYYSAILVLFDFYVKVFFYLHSASQSPLVASHYRQVLCDLFSSRISCFLNPLLYSHTDLLALR